MYNLINLYKTLNILMKNKPIIPMQKAKLNNKELKIQIS